MKYGSKIKFLRKNLNLSQKQLANGICSVSYLSKIEKDTTIPSTEIIELLCKRLNIPNDQLKSRDSLLMNLYLDLDELGGLINTGDAVKSINKYNLIVNKYLNDTDPEVLLIINLFGLRTAILQGYKEKAKEYYFIVLNLKEYLSTPIRTYYFKFCGLYNYLYGCLSEALKNYKKAENLICKKNTLEDVYYQLSLIYHKINQPFMSIDYIKKAEELYVKKMDYKSCIDCNLLLAINYRKLGEYGMSRKIYESILETNLEDDNKKLFASIYHNIGLTFSSETQSSKAIDYFLKSVDIKLSEGYEVINTIYLLTKEYWLNSNKNNALNWLTRGIDIYNKKPHDESYYIKLCFLEYIINNKDETDQYYNYLTKTVIPYFDSRNDLVSLIEFLHYLAKYFKKKKMYKSAYQTLERIISLQEFKIH
ncbi:helix-turn-helix domain-containing protein [Bacillus salitolerans]|uniref:Helix-turn-helix domain-containing protein n=1 Tax=Bacillus salitolerans TaxID=1437434 RepID=A0ABW4LP40_9BACI